ncbi:acyl-CoA dehydrogenase family protein [Streptomyces sp. NPDC050738]|uniref:acyl-CoA dehydrogenase family protein n=1 Tax=Streptomyces sp. NPDC050738 TaxID=3154744 RepID=UPI00342B6E4C
MVVAVHRTEYGEAAVQERIARLELALGDIDDPGNPLGAQQFMLADEQRRMLPAAERLLDDFGLNGEFVPVRLGGRLERMDALSRVMRAVFRRDASLGLGYGLTSYLGAVLVWASGTDAQQRSTAELLLGGSRLAPAYPEPARGNDFLNNRLTAAPAPGGYLLSGVKDALNNAARAGALLLFADTGGQGDEDQSVFLVQGPGPQSTGMRLTERRRTVGVRGCTIQGIGFQEHRLGAASLLGTPGSGRAQAERVFPLTRGPGLSMALGCVDTALRTSVAFARSHRSRGSASLRTTRTRTALVNAFVDLLICDCLSLVATRSVHLLPRESVTLGAVAKYLLPSVLAESVDDLSTVLGAESYSRGGTYGIFQKAARDLPMIGLGSAGTGPSRLVVIRQLLRLPELQGRADDAPAGLFRPFDADLPPYVPQERGLTPAADSLLASLDASVRRAAAAAGGEQGAVLASAAHVLATELRSLYEECARLAAPHGRPTLSPRAYALADRYALIVAGAACLGVWRHRADARSGFLADPAWAARALTRIVGRLGHREPRGGEAGEDRLLAELLERFDDARSYDLYATAIGR